MTTSGISGSLPYVQHQGLGKTTKHYAKKALHAIDEYTKPRDDTEGNIGNHSILLGCSVSDGLAVMGVKGLLGSVVAPAFGLFVANKTGSTTIGVIAGTGMAMALGVGASLLTGSPLVSTVVFSGLLGAYGTFRGNTHSETRDAASGANILNAPFVHGPLKLAAAIGAATGTKVESKIGKAIVGGAVSAVIGSAIALGGFSPVSVPVAAIASFCAGALGPFFGPRFSQFFRNLSNDIGIAIGKLEKKLGFKKETDPTYLNMIGAVPSSLIKEGLRTYALSDGKAFNTIFACIGESFKQSYIFYKQIKEKEGAPGSPRSTELAHLLGL